MPVIPIPGGLRQEHHSDLKATMGCTVCSGSAWTVQEINNKAAHCQKPILLQPPLVYPVLTCCL